jgi:glucokinase
MLLAGDIGGTKTNLALYSPDSGPRKPITEATFTSAKYNSLEAIVKEFIEAEKVIISYASFGVAGPVVGGEAQITNLPWYIEATANAIPFMDSTDLYSLKNGTALMGGTMAVIAPGTGLGEAYLTWDGSGYRAFGSEGGHVDFAPTSPLEIELLEFLKQRYAHVSYERVCSGRGIPNIYDFYKQTGLLEEPEWLAEELIRVTDRTPLIAKTALDKGGECAICERTLETFVSILGAETGNVALKFLATGGIFLGGGIPPRIIPALESGSFLKSYRNKGRFVELLDEIPIYVILNPKSALFGAACVGLEMTN